MAAERHPRARRACGGSLIGTAADAGVFGHAQIVEDQAHVARELAHFLGDAARPAGFDHADGEAAQPGDVFRAVAHSDTAAVLVEVPIENVVTTVL